MRAFLEDRTSRYLDQSVRDVPCRVRFAGESSLMTLSKWGGEASLVIGAGGDYGGPVSHWRDIVKVRYQVVRKYT